MTPTEAMAAIRQLVDEVAEITGDEPGMYQSLEMALDEATAACAVIADLLDPWLDEEDGE